MRAEGKDFLNPQFGGGGNDSSQRTAKMDGTNGSEAIPMVHPDIRRKISPEELMGQSWVRASDVLSLQPSVMT